jgi:hypothetical protein
LKLRNFKKTKITDYNSWVPPNFQKQQGTVGEIITPLILMTFGLFEPPPRFRMIYSIVDQQGDAPFFEYEVNGTYVQKGNSIRLEVDRTTVDPSGMTVPVDCDSVVPAQMLENTTNICRLKDTFAELTENSLFGDRDLVVDVPFARITNPNKLRFKAKVKGSGDQLKLKLETKLRYDIQDVTHSEFADIFGAKGKMKLRAETKKCPN